MQSSPALRRVVPYVLGSAFLALAACSSEDSPSAGAGGAAGQAQGGSTTGGGGTGNLSGSAGAPAGAGGGMTTAGTGGAAGAAGSAGAGGSAGGGGSGGGASGGSGGAAGGGGSAGMPAYNPCPTNGDPCRIMPLGDSITDGAGSSTGASYRLELFRSAVKANKKIVFVGSHQNGPDVVENMPFPKWQEGHSGWTIDDGGMRSGLYPKIQEWMTNANPDKKAPHIVTLMIGTNDVDIQLDLANAGDRLGKLFDRIFMYAPDALLVVAQIVPTTDDGENQRVQAYNALIPPLVKARADAGKHIAMVDMYGAFTKNASYKTEYMNDKLHPKDPGYVVMAGVWFEKLGPLLK